MKHIFAHGKIVGLVSSDVPAVVNYFPKRKFNVLACAVGNVFRTYNAANLRLLSVSDAHPADVDAIASDERFVYTSCLKVIRAFHLSRQVECTFEGHASTVKFLLPFGSQLISIDIESNLKVWAVEDGKSILEHQFDVSMFQISAVCHPVTYLNKVLLGSKQGRLKLLNVETDSLVYEFVGWNHAVTAIEQSPVVDVVAIGLFSGSIILHNIKFDETMFKLKQSWGAVTSLAFRTDVTSIMLRFGLINSGTRSGTVGIWNLEKQSLTGQIEAAHKGRIAMVAALPGEPIVITSGSDNAIRSWIFDNADLAVWRPLCALEGHSTVPSIVRFVEDIAQSHTDSVFLSGGGNESKLHMFSVLKDTKKYNFGTALKVMKQTVKKLKLDVAEVEYGPITCIAVGTAREMAWDNVACCHKDSFVVTTWSTHKTKFGQHRLCHNRFRSVAKLRNAVAECCALSVCGNFVVIGYSSGHLDTFNIQSGAFRGSYKNQQLQIDKAHEVGINGVCTDSLNLQTISGDTSGALHFWRFKKKSLSAILRLDTGVVKMTLQRENNLLAVATTAMSLFVVDSQCKRVVRHFANAHTAPFSDICFSASGHWLLSAARDRTVKVWNLPSAELVDVMRFSCSCTSLAISQRGEYLATTHEQKLGVYIWTNKFVFEGQFPLQAVTSDERLNLEEDMLALPVEDPSCPENTEQETSSEVEMQSERTVDDENLVTLSGKPTAYWANLLQADVIKERNKPTVPIKAVSAPFFLPTVSGLSDFTFDVSAALDDAASASKVVNLGNLEPLTAFGSKLKAAEDLTVPFDLLKQYGPAAIETEIRSLGLLNGGSLDLLHKFLEMIAACLRKGKDFELVQAYLGLFLKLHRDALWAARDFDFVGILSEIQECSNNRWKDLDEKTTQCLSLLKFFKSAVL